METISITYIAHRFFLSTLAKCRSISRETINYYLYEHCLSFEGYPVMILNKRKRPDTSERLVLNLVKHLMLFISIFTAE